MRLSRLRQMPLAEIVYRGRQEASKWIDRAARTRRDSKRILAEHAPALADSRAAADYLGRVIPARFGPGPATVSSSVWDRLSSARTDVVSAADAICAHRFELLGYEALEFGGTIDWQRDPIAGRRAPLVHWTRINPLDVDAVGDSKVTWELNRHQWLVTLGQAYWLTADRRYATEAAALLRNWIETNPYGVGINWTSSLEVSFRLIAWCWALMLFRDAGVFTPEDAVTILGLMSLHAAHIQRYLSYYFSPNTHLTGEAVGLFYAGVLLHEFRDAGRWRDLGRQILISESHRQILGDGVYVEQATCYERYTLEIYLHFLILSDRHGLAVPADVREGVERMLDFMIAVHRPDGTMPSIGDADGGWLLPLARRGPDDCRGVFAVAAAQLGRTDAAWAAGGAAPEVAWLLGQDGVDRFDRMQAAPPDGPSSRVFRAGGYVVMRSGWGANSHQAILDVGPLGCPASGAHGHADLLGLQCCAYGEEYLADPGTYCYTADARWRDHFRSTSAHGTVVVDGRDQALPAGPFSWRTKPSVRLRDFRSSPDIDFVDAEHEAYADLPDPVRHRRRVIFVKRRYWVVIDDLYGQAEHRFAVRYQFAARPVRVGPELWTAAPGRDGRGLWLTALSAVPLTVQVTEGVLEPIEGWISSGYGRRQPAPMVTYSASAMLPCRVVTLLLPVDRMTEPPQATPCWDADKRLVGVHLADARETIRFDSDRIGIEGERPRRGSATRSIVDATARRSGTI